MKPSRRKRKLARFRAKNAEVTRLKHWFHFLSQNVKSVNPEHWLRFLSGANVTWAAPPELDVGRVGAGFERVAGHLARLPRGKRLVVEISARHAMTMGVYGTMDFDDAFAEARIMEEEIE